MLKLQDRLRASKESAGFTLVEMIIAVVIVGILTAIAIPSYAGVQHRARVAAVETSATNSYMQIYSDMSSPAGAYDRALADAATLSTSEILVTVQTDGYKDNTRVTATWRKDSSISATRGSYQEAE